MRKPRILLCGEFSGIASGYGAISRELLARWYKSGKYEVAELSSGCSPELLNGSTIPWKVYPVIPSKNNQEALNEFNANPLNAFGKHIFEQVCLDFKPDICVTCTDPWMHILVLINSAFRDFYKIVYQSPVDGEPQKAEWLSIYNQCDSLLTYSDWGADLLRRQMNNDSRINGSAYLCADTNVFRPLNKQQLRDQIGFEQDSNIIGMVARNQVRKDFDSLMSIFRKFLDTAPEKIANRSYLYIHTSLPDFGWSLHQMLNEYGLSSRTLWTYRCTRCQFFFPDFYKDVKCYCRRCGAPTAHMTGPRNGISNQELSYVYNLMDVYCQFAFLEGFGIPVVEAASCGVPIFCTDYSGLEDFKHTLMATSIPPIGRKREPESGRYWALIDQDKTVNELIKFFQLPPILRKQKSQTARVLVEQNYNWDNTAAKFATVFDSFNIQDWSHTWTSPSRHFEPTSVPQELLNANPSDVLKWGFINILGRPDLLFKEQYLNIEQNLSQGLTTGRSVGGPTVHGYSPKDALNYILSIRNYINHWERIRCGR